MDGTRSYPEDVKFVVESNSRLHPKEKPAPQKTDAQAVHNSTSAKRHPGIFSTWALRHEWQRATKSLMSWDPLGFRTGKSSQAASFMVDRPFPSKKTTISGYSMLFPHFWDTPTNPSKLQIVHDVDVVDMYKAHAHHIIRVRFLGSRWIGLGNIDPKVMMFPCF
jgi:hypothetical protein